ncbi:hypothetical protein F5Y17DRAFT_462125 [Xylariaceae sp. FL0594]|nr:hypothetical protein F5Y17DRAFT_462125 [Xylariaceae sp. FL0594]
MSGAGWEIIRELSKRLTTTPMPYDNSHDRPTQFNSKKTAEGLIVTFGVVAWICVILRLYTRRRLDALGWDDVFVALFRITGTIVYDNGFGKHYYLIGAANQMVFQKKYYVALLAYVLSTALMKLCLLSQYLRLFAESTRARRVCWLFIVICSMWGFAFSIIALVPCVPLVGFWDMSARASCYGFGSRVPDDLAATYAAHVTTNVALDLIILAIPIPLFFKTFKQKKQRVGFTFMVLLGIFINLVSIWRLYDIIATRAATYPVIDPTFYGPLAVVLACLEIDLASIVASVPVFWPYMVTQHWGKMIFVTQEVHVTRHHRRLSGSEENMDNFELHAAANNGNSAADGAAPRLSLGSREGSLKLVIQNHDQDIKDGAIIVQQTHSRSDSESQKVALSSITTNDSGSTTTKKQRYYDATNDPYVRERVYPLAGGPMMASEAQVVSEGQRGFERNYREHFATAVAADPTLNPNLNSIPVGAGIRPGLVVLSPQSKQSLDKLHHHHEPRDEPMRFSNEDRSRRRDGDGYEEYAYPWYGDELERDRSESTSVSRKSSQRFLK